MTAQIVDQPPPVPNEEPGIWQLVIADMAERDHLANLRGQ